MKNAFLGLIFLAGCKARVECKTIPDDVIKSKAFAVFSDCLAAGTSLDYCYEVSDFVTAQLVEKNIDITSECSQKM